MNAWSILIGFIALCVFGIAWLLPSRPEAETYWPDDDQR